jgi:hypothetical protein
MTNTPQEQNECEHEETVSEWAPPGCTTCGECGALLEVEDQ